MIDGTRPAHASARRAADDTSLAPEDMARLVARLVAMREEILTRHSSHLSPALDGDARESDEMDRASRSQENSFSLQMAEKDRTRIAEIDAALARAADGTYGICEGTGESIGLKRLEAAPWTPFCVEHAETMERDARVHRRAGM